MAEQQNDDMDIDNNINMVDDQREQMAQQIVTAHDNNQFDVCFRLIRELADPTILIDSILMIQNPRQMATFAFNTQSGIEGLAAALAQVGPENPDLRGLLNEAIDQYDLSHPQILEFIGDNI